MKHSIPSAALIILTRLEEAGFEAFIVGGWVRDRLLNISDQDCDLTTNALPHQIQGLFPEFPQSEVGKDHGTIGIKIEGMWIEVTTYRIDKDIHDNRHPGAIEFTQELKEDVLRRDFTINALAMDRHGTLIDLVEGRLDLDRRIIRCVGDPHLRFEEDALRILRGLRLSSKLNFDIEADTLKAMHVHAPLIRSLATERIWNEFSLWMHNPHPSTALMAGKDIVSVFFPEIETVPLEWFKKLDHLNPMMLRWTALFYGVDEPRAIARLKTWKVSNAFLKNLAHHLRLAKLGYPLDVYGLKCLLRDFDAKCVEEALQFQTLFQLPHYQPDAHARLRQLIEDHSVVKISQLDIKGHDLVHVGYRDRGIQVILEDLLDAVMKDELANEKTALISFAKARLP